MGLCILGNDRRTYLKSQFIGNSSAPLDEHATGAAFLAIGIHGGDI